MRKSRFNEEQIIAILKESEAEMETGELCRRYGIYQGELLSLEVEVWRTRNQRLGECLITPDESWGRVGSAS